MKKNLFLAFTGLAMLLSTINVMAQSKTTDAPAIKKGMIKVSILYPAGEGKKFDMDYYTTKHIPMVKGLFGSSLKLTTIEKGLAGSAPGSPAPFVVMCNFYFDSVSAFQSVMAPNATRIRSDIPNYTDIQPVVQISEVAE